MSLSKKTIKVIQSTVPALEMNRVEITTVFYKNMFHNHPELLNIFNQSNQSKGQQQEALANMVYAAAKNIDQLETIIPEVIPVAHKHRALGIKEEHYPIVGKHLLEAIAEVLGEAATEEVLDAWAKAYDVIADVFINMEADMYEQSETQANGWAGFTELEVIDKVKESDVITSFYFKRKDGQDLPQYKPGQYMSIRVEIPGHKYLYNRQYTLSTAPGHDYYRISVKREADHEPFGIVSNYLHDHIQIGDTIEASVPAGNFTLNTEETDPVAFISGGVGLTPMMSMLETLVNEQRDRQATFIHGARHEGVHAFREDVKEMISKLYNGKFIYGYSEIKDNTGNHDFTGYLSKEILAENISKRTICYVCGPIPFLQNIIPMLRELNIPEDNIRYELFGPTIELKDKQSVV